MNIERLYRIHEKIESETTGALEEFAEAFDIKKRQMQYQLDELRLFGAAIHFSRKRNTYFYSTPFDFFEKIDYQHFIRKMNKNTIIGLLKIYLEEKNKNR